VAREAVRLCAWEAGDCQVAIEDRLPDNLPLIYADRVLLEQVLLNLLRNAIDANREAHPGQPSLIVIGAVAQRDGWVQIDVSDRAPAYHRPNWSRYLPRSTPARPMAWAWACP
jgi:signal transduction histidine kinase